MVSYYYYKNDPLEEIFYVFCTTSSVDNISRSSLGKILPHCPLANPPPQTSKEHLISYTSAIGLLAHQITSELLTAILSFPKGHTHLSYPH